MFMGAITNREMGNAITEYCNNRKLRSMQRKTQRDATQMFLTRHSLRSSISLHLPLLTFQVQANWRANTGQFFPPLPGSPVCKPFQVAPRVGFS